MSASDEAQPINGGTSITFFDQLKGFYWMAPRAWRAAVVLGLLLVIFDWPSSAETEDRGLLFGLPVPVLLLLTLAGWLAIMAIGFLRISPQQKQMSYLITAEQIVSRDSTGTALTLPWTGIKRCIESRTGFALRLKPAGVRWLPKRAFEDHALTALRALIADRLGAQAKLRK